MMEKQPEVIHAGLRPQDVLTALQPQRWRTILEVEHLAETAEVTRETRDGISRVLHYLSEGLTILNSPVREGLERVLQALEGKKFGSLEANQAVARQVQALLSRLGLRVICPKPGCGLPAVMRCAAAGNSKQGVFQFDHSSGGRRTTHLGSSFFPDLKLVDAPPDTRRARP